MNNKADDMKVIIEGISDKEVSWNELQQCHGLLTKLIDDINNKFKGQDCYSEIQQLAQDKVEVAICDKDGSILILFNQRAVPRNEYVIIRDKNTGEIDFITNLIYDDAAGKLDPYHYTEDEYRNMHSIKKIRGVDEILKVLCNSLYEETEEYNMKEDHMQSMHQGRDWDKKDINYRGR